MRRFRWSQSAVAEADARVRRVEVGPVGRRQTDTFVEDIPAQEHRPRPWGPGNNPATALRTWLEEADGFEPDPFVNAKLLVTASPGGYLRRVR